MVQGVEEGSDRLHAVERTIREAEEIAERVFEKLTTLEGILFDLEAELAALREMSVERRRGSSKKPGEAKSTEAGDHR
jgi:hypothetical protein